MKNNTYLGLFRCVIQFEMETTRQNPQQPQVFENIPLRTVESVSPVDIKVGKTDSDTTFVIIQRKNSSEKEFFLLEFLC